MYGGLIVRTSLAGRVVTLGDPGHEGAFYVEELTRFAGMRAQGSRIPAEGDMVSLSGLMSTIEGERAVVGADVVTISSANPLPPPLGMWNKLLGGGPFGEFTLGVEGGFGLQNIGLLVRIWGQVTQIGEDYLYIDDGSNLHDGTLTGEEDNIGVRIICDPAGYSPNEWLAVNGISSCFETPSSAIARRVITRREEDVQRLGE